MARPLQFVRLETSLKGLTTKAISEWDRYLPEGVNSGEYHWVVISDPEVLARTLEVLSTDLPEEDLSMLVRRLPYLIMVFQKEGNGSNVPVESTIAFLATLNQAGLVTVLRQCSDRERLAPFFKLEPSQWSPLFFLLGGKPNLDASFEAHSPGNSTFF